ncbi:MAG: tRNA-dihydrouridine synthase [Microgenomates bacterium 39_7]|nr:MAG: tRNA-dihydrouridine synthase [Microgenomates bacterium 39_7]
MTNFWQNLPQPFVGMAPMDGVTDQPLRHILCKYSSPDLIFTEFVNVEGLCHNAKQLLRPLLYDGSQRPIVAQLYGKTPESFRQAAILVAQLGFDGVDINMGCPAKSVAGAGSGAGLIKNPQLALQIIKAVKKGVSDWQNGLSCSDCTDFSSDFCKQVEKQRQQAGLQPIKEIKQRSSIPVSIKTRLGHDSKDVGGWIKLLLEAKPTALTVHGRTLKQAYKGKADWEAIFQVVALAKEMNSDTLIVGNGDVQSRTEGIRAAQKHQVNGVLIGRAAQGNPFVFDKDTFTTSSTFHKQLATIALEHAQLFEETFSTQEKYSFLPVRKHLAWYIKGFPQASQIRQQLVQTNSSKEVEKVLSAYGLLN